MNWRTRWLLVFLAVHGVAGLATYLITTADSFSFFNTPEWKWLLYFTVWRVPGALTAIWLVLGATRIDVRLGALVSVFAICAAGLYAPWVTSDGLWVLVALLFTQFFAVAAALLLARATFLKPIARAGHLRSQMTIAQLLGITAVVAVGIVAFQHSLGEPPAELFSDSELGLALLHFAIEEIVIVGCAIFATLPWRRDTTCLWLAVPLGIVAIGGLFLVHTHALPLEPADSVYYAHLVVALFVLRTLGMRVECRRRWFWRRAS